MDIKDRRVLISGASRGLGRTLAFAFAEAGAREVFAGARKGEDIEKLKSDARVMNAPIIPIKLDVTVDEDIRAIAFPPSFPSGSRGYQRNFYGMEMRLKKKITEGKDIYRFGGPRVCRCAFNQTRGSSDRGKRSAPW